MNHCTEIADARFELGHNAEHFARMADDHMNIADETSAFRRAFMGGLVVIITVALIGLALLWAAQGERIAAKVKHQIEEQQ